MNGVIYAKEKFDDGWDVYREKVFANQKKVGIDSGLCANCLIVIQT